MNHLFSPLLAVLLAVSPALAEENDDFNVDQHMVARSIYVDAKGRCIPENRITEWTLASYPAEVPSFETCSTISSKTARGEVEFEFEVVGADSKPLFRLDGVLVLSPSGMASQAIEWDHLQIPSPGTYHMVLRINGKKVKRFPMIFKTRRAEPSPQP